MHFPEDFFNNEFFAKKSKWQT